MPCVRPLVQGACPARIASAEGTRGVRCARLAGRFARPLVPPPAQSIRSHGQRADRPADEGRNPVRGVAVYPALPRQDHRREIRRQRDGRPGPEGSLRARRRAPQAGRHEPGRRPRRRSADRRGARAGRQETHLHPGHARHRRRDHGSRRVGARRGGAGRARHDDQPLRRPGRGPDRQGRRFDPRTEAPHARQGRPVEESRHRPGRRDRGDQPGRRESAAGRRLHSGDLADRFRRGRRHLQHQRRRRGRQDRRDPEGREARDADEHAGRARQERPSC